MEEKRRLNVGFVTSNPLVKTGFSHNAKNLLPILYKLNKYNLFLLAQSSQDNDPNFQRMPWVTKGVFKNFDQNRFNQDPAYQRYVAYGNSAVEDFVVNNRLDVCFHIEDIWSSDNGTYLNSEWFKHIKNNFVQWSTADSEPILPNFKEWAEKCPNLWFWSSFAERCLKEENNEKYGHCKTLHGSINGKLWYSLPSSQRQTLRQNFGIKDDEKIIIYLGRNQLRKLFWSHMEALQKFKRWHPDKKVRLLFHCSWNEPAGWPLDRIRDELKLEKSDILASYYCKNCGFWNVQPFEGEDLDCPICKMQRNRITAGVGSSITEEDLNKIYNLADGSCSVFTSGGFEYTHAESLLAGLPLASVNYSCGEDFCNKDFVYTIQGSFTRECGTAFKKFVPDINSIVKFYEYICNLDSKKKREIVDNGRKWALENFDAPVIAKTLETFIDSCNPIDWEAYHNKKKELKDPNAPIEDIQDDFEFVCTAYERILKMMDMRDRTKDETRHWLQFLSQPGDKNKLKNELLNTFRSIAAQKNAEVQKITLEDLLDKNDKERVLLVLKESCGDEYLLTSLLPEIQKKYSEASIYIGCDQKYFEVFEMNEYVKKCIPWSQELENELLTTGHGSNKGLFNVSINVGISTQRILNYISQKY